MAPDLTALVGKMLMAGFEGYELLPNSPAEQLIRKYRVHAFILYSKNFLNVKQMKSLIQSLQDLAKSEGYEYPLLIAVDQELGCCNSMYDSQLLTQFPGAMGLGATADLDLIFQVGKAAAEELRAVGFNLYMGPVLDVCSSIADQIVGIRTFASTKEEVTAYASAFAKGIRAGGMLTSAKHFPGIGSAFVDNLVELPLMLETAQEVETSTLLPFKDFIANGLADSVHVSGVAMPNVAFDDIRSCLPPVMIHRLLRTECKFDGLAISECMEYETLSKIGSSENAIMSVLYSGCDMIMYCSGFAHQKEALHSLRNAYELGNFQFIFKDALRRINNVLAKLSWPSSALISRQLLDEHALLSEKAYRESITLVRDNNSLLPITKHFTTSGTNNILLLTPLILPIHPAAHHSYPNADTDMRSLLPGEDVFRDFGEALSSYDKSIDYDVLHTSYTANGLTDAHEALINRAKVVVVVCAEAGRNMYQIGVAKHVSLLCGAYKNAKSPKKPVIIVAVTTPNDFLYYQDIAPTYICTYDYTSSALRNIPPLFFGAFKPTGRIPKGNEQQVTMHRSPSSSISTSLSPNLDSPTKLLDKVKDDSDDSFKFIPAPQNVQSPTSPTSTPVKDEVAAAATSFQYWPVEQFNLARDFNDLIPMLQESFGSNFNDSLNTRRLHSLLSTQNDGHFVVRNAEALLGVVLTWSDSDSTNGRIALLAVNKFYWRQSVGLFLHQHAINYLTLTKGCKTVTLGCDFPLLNIMKSSLSNELADNWTAESPSKLSTAASRIMGFFKALGWTGNSGAFTRKQPVEKCILTLDMNKWEMFEKLFKQLKVFDVEFEVSTDHQEIIDLIRHNNFKPDQDEALFVDMYKLASSCMAPEAEKQKRSTLIFKVIESTTKSLIGSIIAFNDKSTLADWYPCLNTSATASTYLTGVFVDSEYSALKAVMKLCLICTGVSVAKQFQSKRVILDNFIEEEARELIHCGFEVDQEYISSVGIKMGYEWPV